MSMEIPKRKIQGYNFLLFDLHFNSNLGTKTLKAEYVKQLNVYETITTNHVSFEK